jgi:hypothetical protein
MASVSSTQARTSRKMRSIDKRTAALDLDFGHHSSWRFTVKRSPELARSRAFIGQPEFQFHKSKHVPPGAHRVQS